MKPAIGLIGLGLMGRPMGMNLLKAGYSLTVWNRTASRADELVAAGAKLAESPQGVAGNCEFLLTMVSDPPALEEILWGPSGAMQALKRGAVYVDSSTISPALARKIAGACGERGASLEMAGGIGHRARHGWWNGGDPLHPAGVRRAGNGVGRPTRPPSPWS